jgi:hypothetical protein
LKTLYRCLAAVLAGIAVAILLVLVAGCASEPAAKVCYLRPLGQTAEGYAVVLQACQSPQEFAESQK